MMGVCEELRQAFNNCDVSRIVHLLQSEDYSHTSFRDEAHGLQSLLMRLCHLHISPEERGSITDSLLGLNLQPRPQVDINAVDVAGRTALCHACIAERTDMIAALAHDEKCDPNLADKDGNTPLIYAVKSRRPEVVEMLIDCFLPRGLNVNHCNKKGVCALAEAEHHCDGAICRLLLQKANANPAALEQVQLPRDVRMWKTPRSPTPEMLASSPRKKSLTIKRNTEILSPLVASGTRQKSNLTSSSLCSFQEETDNDLENLSDVQEHEEEEGVGPHVNGFRKLGPQSKKNSNSLPDLRVQGAVSLVQSKKRTGAGIPLSHSSPSFNNEAMYQRSMVERRMTHPTLDDVALPQLSEEEEEEEDEEQRDIEQKRAASLSLPHLSHLLPNKRVAVTKKANGAYVTYSKHLENGNLLNGTDSERRIQLPQLNLSSQSQLLNMNGNTNRKGFQGTHTISGKKKKQKSSPPPPR